MTAHLTPQPTHRRPAADPDLQVVGGGVAGLVAAALAADRGLRVRLYERRTEPGGRATTAEHDGFRLNQGPHALYATGALWRCLDHLGILPAGTKPEVRGGLGSIGDRVDLLPQGPGSIARTSLLSATEKARFISMFLRLPRIDTTSLGSVSVEEWIADTFPEGDLRTLLGGLVSLTTYSRADSVASADAAVANLKLGAGPGVRYLHHGWQSIVDALHRRCVESGAVEFDHTPVQRVTASGDRWTCATAAGEVTSGAVVVAVGSPAATDRLLGTEFVATAGPPVRAAALDLGLRRRPSTSTLIGLDSRLYASLHSVATGLAPGGSSLVALARYVPPTEGDSAEAGAESTADRDLLLDHAERAGIDLDDVVMQRYLHRLPVGWGTPLARQGGLAGRPAVAVGERPGLFVAGDWVGPEGLLADASAASASAAVATIAATASGRVSA